MPSRQIGLLQRKRWPDELYARAEELLTEQGVSPNSAALARALDSEFPGEAPGERTVRDWIRRGVIRPIDPATLWNLANARPGEAECVLPVLAAIDARNRRVTRSLGRPVLPPILLRDEARILARLSEAIPGLQPDVQFEIARFYAGMSRAGMSTAWLDRFLGHVLALEAWTTTGRQALEDAIADGDVEPPVPFLSGIEGGSIDLFGAIEQGKQRLRAAKEVSLEPPRTR